MLNSIWQSVVTVINIQVFLSRHHSTCEIADKMTLKMAVHSGRTILVPGCAQLIEQILYSSATTWRRMWIRPQLQQM